MNYLRHSAVYPEVLSVCCQTFSFMSFITGLGYFVSFGNYNDQTCFPLQDAVISQLLTNAPAHIDKHMTRKKGDYVCNLCYKFMLGV